MTPTKQEMLLWTGALSLALTAVWGAAVLDGQIVMTQTGSASASAFGGPADKPIGRGTGIVFGKTVEFGTTRPVAGAIVTLGLPGVAPLRVIADAQGQFVFRDLPKGGFTLSATKFGYIDGAYGRVRPSGPAQSIDLSDGQHLADASIPLWKYAVMTGRVLDENGEPLVNSTVRTLKRTTAAGRRQLVMSGSSTTDDRGIYRIGSLEPGEYVVVVPMTQGSPLGSLFLQFGLPRDLPAPPPTGGATAGVMMFTTDVQINGGPAGGATRMFVTGPDSGAPPAGTSADGHALTYQTEFYPSSLTAGRATAVTVTSGEERSGIDFQLKPVRAVNLRGTVNAPDGPAGGVSLSLVPAEADDLITPIETASAATNDNGEFRFANIPPGQYTLRATKMPRSAPPAGATTTFMQGGGDTMQMRVVTRSVAGAGAPAPPLPTEPTLWTEMSVSVGEADLTDLAVPLRTGLRVSGRVDFTGSIDRPASDQLPAIPLSLEPADGRPSTPLGTVRGRIEPTGQFTTIGVAAGKYVLRVGAPRGWTLEAASYNGQDVTDAPIELKDNDATGVVITFVDRQTDLSGVVTSATGTPDGAADVIAFTTDRSLWSAGGSSPRRLKSVRTGPNGAYSTGNLPPGDYYVAAVSDTVAADWQNVEFLEGLTRSAVRVTIGAGEKKTQALTTTRIR
jgi:hypothetical protein